MSQIYLFKEDLDNAIPLLKRLELEANSPTNILVVNIALDILFIKYMHLGMYGAGLATAIAYASCGLFILYFFISKKSELKIIPKNFGLDFSIVNEIIRLGGVSIARQGTISILMIVLNYSLYKYGGEISISIFGIINRVMMFALASQSSRTLFLKSFALKKLEC